MPRREPIPESLMREVAAEIVARERAEFDRKARAAGWVPLVEVLDALRSGPNGWFVDESRRVATSYLAERFGEVPR